MTIRHQIIYQLSYYWNVSKQNVFNVFLVNDDLQYCYDIVNFTSSQKTSNK